MFTNVGARIATASISLLLLGVLLLIGLQSRAQADDPAPVTISAAPDLNWGFKETWRNYAQEPQVSGGAAITAPAGHATYDLAWKFESGSYDPATQTTSLSYSGSAHWRKYRASQLGYPTPPGYSGEPDPYILDVTLS